MLTVLADSNHVAIVEADPEVMFSDLDTILRSDNAHLLNKNNKRTNEDRNSKMYVWQQTHINMNMHGNKHTKTTHKSVTFAHLRGG